MPDSDRGIEPPAKKVRASPTRDANGATAPGRGRENARSHASVKAVSEDLAFGLNSIDAAEALGDESNENEEEIIGGQIDGKDNRDVDNDLG